MMSRQLWKWAPFPVVTCFALFLLSASRPAVLAGSAGVVHSATGSGHIASISATEGYWDNYSFSAIQRADGTVSGEIQYSDRVEGFVWHAEVIDLKVEGNKAKITGRFTRPPGPPLWPEGLVYVFLVVVDGGEGHNAPEPDQVSWSILSKETGCGCRGSNTSLDTLKGFSIAEFLAWEANIGLEPQLYTYINGNIQVR